MSSPSNSASYLQALPTWARELSEKYYSRSYALFVLYGTGTTAVYRLAPDGTGFTVIHNFVLKTFITGGLVQGRDGNLYGTTQASLVHIYGSVFQLSPDGSTFNTLHAFDLTNGSKPDDDLLLGSDGRLYGTTQEGGTHTSAARTASSSARAKGIACPGAGSRKRVWMAISWVSHFRVGGRVLVRGAGR